MASTSGSGGAGSSEGGDGAEKKGKAVQKREYRKGKQHKTYSLADKEKIVNMIEAGARTCEIVKALGVPESSVRNIRKAKSEVKKNIESAKKYFPKAGPSRGIRERSVKNHMLLITEHFLLNWLTRRLEEKQSVDGVEIRRTAREYYAGVCAKKKVQNPPPFTASKGWLQRFKKRCSIKHASYQGEIASADAVAAKAFIPVAKQIIDEGNYSPDQVFNCDETAFYWRRAPTSTFIPKEVKQASGHKLAKDKFSVLFTCNASGECKMKPLVIYKFAKPHSFRNCDMENLPNCIWLHNASGYMTIPISVIWFDKHFVPDAKRHCKKKNIPFKVVLFLDNAPGHAKFLVGRHPAVQVVFMPPNTTAKLQPLDQELIANVKLIFYGYLHDKIKRATDSRKEMKDIEDLVSSGEEEVATPDPPAASPSPAAPPPLSPASPVASTSAQPTTPQAPRSPVASTSAVPPVAPQVVLSMKQFWKTFQIKQAVDLMSRSWSEITLKTIRHAWSPLLPHLNLQEEERQKQETLLQQTTNSIQQVPGMATVDNEAVADIVRERTRELTLQEMMEEEEQEVDQETSTTGDKEITTKELSNILGLCAILKEETSNKFKQDEEHIAQAAQHLEKFTAVFKELYHKKLASTQQAKITDFFNHQLARQRMIHQGLADILGDEDAEILDNPSLCDTAAEEPQAPPPAHISPVSQEDAEFLGFEEVDTAAAREVAARGEDLEMDPGGGGGN